MNKKFLETLTRHIDGFWGALAATVMIVKLGSCLLVVVFEYYGLSPSNFNYKSSDSLVWSVRFLLLSIRDGCLEELPWSLDGLFSILIILNVEGSLAVDS